MFRFVLKKIKQIELHKTGTSGKMFISYSRIYRLYAVIYYNSTNSLSCSLWCVQSSLDRSCSFLETDDLFARRLLCVSVLNLFSSLLYLSSQENSVFYRTVRVPRQLPPVPKVLPVRPSPSSTWWPGDLLSRPRCFSIWTARLHSGFKHLPASIARQSRPVFGSIDLPKIFSVPTDSSKLCFADQVNSPIGQFCLASPAGCQLLSSFKW